MAEASEGLTASQKIGKETSTKTRNIKKGSPFKSGKLIAGAVFIFIFIPILIHQMKDWWKELKTQVATEQQAPKVPSVVVRSPTTSDWYGKEVTLTISRADPMKPIRVDGTQCIRWDEPDGPDSDTFTAYVRDVNEPGWLTHREYREKYPGRGFGFIKFVPNEGRDTAVVLYTLKRKGECT